MHFIFTFLISHCADRHRTTWLWIHSSAKNLQVTASSKKNGSPSMWYLISVCCSEQLKKHYTYIFSQSFLLLLWWEYPQPFCSNKLEICAALLLAGIIINCDTTLKWSCDIIPLTGFHISSLAVLHNFCWPLFYSLLVWD